MQLDPDNIGDESTGVVRNRGLDPSFDQLDNMASGNDIIEQIRSESKKLKLKPVQMTKEIEKLVVGYEKSEHEDNPESSANCCSVCLIPFEDGDKTVPLPCNTEHVFHKKCLLEWAQQSYTCPICRTPVISSENEIKLYEIMQ